MSAIVDFVKGHKWEVGFALFMVLMLVLEWAIPKRDRGTARGPGDYGPVRVEYMFKGPEMVPYEPSPTTTTVKPLWAPNQNPDKTPPLPKTSGFKTSISRQAMSVSSGYDGGCELPKVVRESTNTAFCMTCHEQHDVTSPLVTPISLDSSHPVGVSVPIGRPDYQPVVSSELVMVNGVIECTTCHNYWATPRWPKWVAVDPVNLCQSCHNK